MVVKNTNLMANYLGSNHNLRFTARKIGKLVDDIFLVFLL